jgi:hypothetical protein
VPVTKKASVGKSGGVKPKFSLTALDKKLKAASVSELKKLIHDLLASSHTNSDIEKRFRDTFAVPLAVDESSTATGKVKKMTKVMINAGLKVAPEAKLKAFCRDLYQAHSGTLIDVYVAFSPSAVPVKADKDDALLKICFHCHDTASRPFHGVSICNSCHAELDRHDTITRDKVMSYFGLSKGEADKLPRKSGTGGFFRGIIYKYKIGTCVKACSKKYGSMFSFLKSKFTPRTTTVSAPVRAVPSSHVAIDAIESSPAAPLAEDIAPVAESAVESH